MINVLLGLASSKINYILQYQYLHNKNKILNRRKEKEIKINKIHK